MKSTCLIIVSQRRKKEGEGEEIKEESGGRGEMRGGK